MGAISVKKQAELDAAKMLQDILKAHGVKQETVNHEPEELNDTPQRVQFRGQAVLRSLEFPSEERLTKTCKNPDCGNIFTSNYHSVAYCSVLCMEEILKRDYGIAWRPHARIKRERWEVRAEPEMIPMRALQAMKMIVARVESDLGYPIPIEQEAFSRIPSGLLKESQSPSAYESPSVSPAPELPLSDSPKSQALKVHSFEEEDDLLASLFADDD